MIEKTMLLPDLAGHAALVTGTANGIGLAVAKALLAQSCAVHGLDRDASPDLGAGYTHHRCDLSQADAVRDAVTTIAATRSTLDHVVNVAGIDPLLAIDAAGAEDWARVVDLDLRAYYLVIHHSVALLRRGQGRSIVNVSSINYRLGVPKRALYATAKAGILGLTTGLARELGKDGIRINTVSPGWVFTERQEREYFGGDQGPKHLDYLRSRQSLDLRISPDDIASHILFYLSNASRASTGHNCVVDGGWLLE